MIDKWNVDDEDPKHIALSYKENVLDWVDKQYMNEEELCLLTRLLYKIQSNKNKGRKRKDIQVVELIMKEVEVELIIKKKEKKIWFEELMVLKVFVMKDMIALIE